MTERSATTRVGIVGLCVIGGLLIGAWGPIMDAIGSRASSTPDPSVSRSSERRDVAFGRATSGSSGSFARSQEIPPAAVTGASTDAVARQVVAQPWNVELPSFRLGAPVSVVEVPRRFPMRAPIPQTEQERARKEALAEQGRVQALERVRQGMGARALAERLSVDPEGVLGPEVALEQLGRRFRVPAR